MRFDCILLALCGVVVALTWVVDKRERDVVMRAIYEFATSASVQRVLAPFAPHAVCRVLHQLLG